MFKMNKEFYLELREEIKPFFEKRGSHSFDHTERVYNISLNLAKDKEIDLDVIKASALLHDIARKKQDETNKEICHAEEGAKIAEEILKKHNFSENKIKLICNSISCHRYSKGLKAETLEAQILQDADRLDALGAITIARIFDYGAKKNRPIYNPLIKTKDYKHNSESDTSINHFYEKILKIIPESFNTDQAKEIARERYKFVSEFVDRFIKEWKGEL